MFSCNICKDKGFTYLNDRGYSIIKKCSCKNICDICSNVGYLEKYDGEYRFLKKCSCKLFTEKIQKYNEAKIPIAYAQKTISGFKFDYDKKIYDSQKLVISDLTSYLKSFDNYSKSILLYGSNGTGKTHLLIAMLSYLILNHDLSGYYMDFPQWIVSKKFNMNTLQQEIDFVSNVDILVMDEFAKTNNREFDKEKMEEIFYNRYNKSKITFIATNFSPVKSRDALYLGDMISEALLSRLSDYYFFDVFNLVWNDYRVYR